MAWSIDSFTNPVSSTGSISTSQSATVATASGRKMIVFVRAPVARTFTVTYNGVSFGSAVATANYNFDTQKVHVFILNDPDTGTHNIVVTADVAATFVTCAVWVKDTDPTLDAAASAAGHTTNTAITRNITTVADDAGTILWCNVGSGNPAAGTGSTLVNTPGLGQAIFVAGPHGTPGSQSMQYTMSSSSSGSIILAIKDLVVAPQIPPLARGQIL